MRDLCSNLGFGELHISDGGNKKGILGGELGTQPVLLMPLCSREK